MYLAAKIYIVYAYNMSQIVNRRLNCKCARKKGDDDENRDFMLIDLHFSYLFTI
jgi:hypothetical protein